ncbi:MAG TPA: ATP-binding protein, partial [Sedimentisphaerales bacterium]
MSERIEEIKFLHFRGLPDYCCPLKGKSLAVFAGNGKGKSGIVDGIEFLFSGRIRRFLGEGTGRINPGEAIRHIQKKGDPVVELHFSPLDSNKFARRTLSQVSVLQISKEPTIQAYIASHPAVDAFILRRTQILEFIFDQDATRYKKYIQLLGLAVIDDIQRSFVEAAQTAESRWQTSQQSLTLQLEAFRDPVSGWSPASLASVLTKCSEIVRPLGIEDLNDWTNLGSAIARLEAKRSAETKAKIDAFNKAITSLERLLPDGLPTLV